MSGRGSAGAHLYVDDVSVYEVRMQMFKHSGQAVGGLLVLHLRIGGAQNYIVVIQYQVENSYMDQQVLLELFVYSTSDKDTEIVAVSDERGIYYFLNVLQYCSTTYSVTFISRDLFSSFSNRVAVCQTHVLFLACINPSLQKMYTFHL